MLCTNPKNTVNPIATHSPYHCNPSRRSFHHCFRVDGRDSSNASFIITIRSCQYTYCSMRCDAEPQANISISGTESALRTAFLYQRLVDLLCGGKRMLSV